MSVRSRLIRLGVGAMLVAGMAMPAAGVLANGGDDARPPHMFVIMLENHSQSSVIDDVNAPYITSLAHTYGMASNYYGVTHPSLPNYVAAISGSNWFVNDDQPTNTFNHTNLVDQLESHGKSWAAYMDTLPSAGFTGAQYPATDALYVNKHNPFVLFTDVLSSPARLAKIKPYTSLQADLNSSHAPDFVWISPNQCNDMHGGVFNAVPGHPETPCVFGKAKDDVNDASLKAKADAFVQGAVTTIMSSKAWTGNSVIFVLTDENDFTNNASTDGWESAAGCCDSPILPPGYAFLNSHGIPDGNTWAGGMYGGGLIPAIVIARHGVRHYVSTNPYNHYSLLRTIEEAWGLGYLGNASDTAQVHSMREFLHH